MHNIHREKNFANKKRQESHSCLPPFSYNRSNTDYFLFHLGIIARAHQVYRKSYLVVYISCKPNVPL